jgi:release factor glutamine methyltransferase
MNPLNESNSAGHRSDEAAWTILRLLSWTSEYFASHDIENPRADAEILLAHSLGLRRIDLYVQHDKPLTSEELTLFRGMVRRRGRREPVAYITGEKEFWSLPLKVTPEVLIPRPETECLVEAALEILSKDKTARAGRVLDLGTGSGAIVLSLATERPHDVLVAVERSPAALAIARENAGRHGLASRIRFLKGDWFDPLDQGETFDLIVSNPPYVRRDDIGNLQPEVSRFEPVPALDGGPDGAECLAQIIQTAPRYLRPSGSLLMEMGYDQAALLEGVARKAGCYEEPVFLKDYSGLDRVVHLQKRS